MCIGRFRATTSSLVAKGLKEVLPGWCRLIDGGVCAAYKQIMSIRFACPSCDQPIEVDDQWASRNVACPYCRTTVLAPESSTYETDEIPVASPASFTGAVPAAGFGGTPAWLGTVAAVSSVAALALLFVASLMLSNYLEEHNLTPEDLRELLTPEQAPPEVMTAMSLVFAALGLWAAGVICCLMGRRSPGGRLAAHIALGVSVVIPLVFFSGVMAM